MGKKCCCCDFNEPCVSNFALVLTITGLVFVLISFLWPINPNFVLDPTTSAQENEDRQAAHARMLTTLYTVNAVGMGLLVIGGIVTSVLLTKVFLADECCQESGRICGRRPKDDEVQLHHYHHQTSYQQDENQLQQLQQVAYQLEKQQHQQQQQQQQQPPYVQLHQQQPPSDHLAMNREVSNAPTYGTVGN